MNLLLKLIASSLLFVSGISKVLNIEAFEFFLVESGLCNWEVAPVLVRLIIIIEFFVGVSILAKTVHVKLTSVVILLLSLVFIIDFFQKPTDGLYPNEFLFFLYNKWVSLLGITFLLFYSIYSCKKDEVQLFGSRWKNILLNTIFTLSFAIPVLVINPLFVDDFQKNDGSVSSPILEWDNIYLQCKNEGVELKKDTSTLFVFFSTSCYYCNRSAKMFGISNRVSNNSPSVVLVFPGNKEDTDAFIKRNKCNFPFIRITKDEFRAHAGNEYPAYFKVKNRKETHYFTGETFNYRELDALFD